MTEKFDIPTRKTQLSHSFFERDAVSVAQGLLGRVFVVERPRTATLYARLQEVAAWEGKVESTSEGASYAPGIVSISTKYGQRLIDIATSKFGKPSCVTLVAGTVRDGAGIRKFAQGAGMLAESLEVDLSYNNLPLNSHNNSSMWIGGQSIDPALILKRNLCGLPDNCQGYFYFRY